ncbi:MAG: EutN/CcmL family microcompartment protein [Elusimicrobiaceae bacterium]
MKLGEVVGRTFCSIQHKTGEGKKLLLVKPLDWMTGEPAGDILVAADCVGAGWKEKVFFVQSREAIVAFSGQDGPASAGTEPPAVDAAIVGIVDGWQIGGRVFK